MPLFLVTLAVTLTIFGLAVLLMAVGLILRGKVLRGGCGSVSAADGSIVACESCSKKELNLCDENDSMGLAGPSFAGTLGRFHKKTE